MQKPSHNPSSTWFLRWGALCLSPSQLQVSYDDTLLPLTPMQYRLLEALLHRAPAILSARTLAQQDWGDVPPPSKGKIRDQIQHLRQVLHEGGAPADFIATVPRQGYQLNPLYGEAVPTQNSGSSSGGAGCVGLGLEAERQRTAAHLACLADITDAFSRLSTAQEIMQAVGERVGAYLSISRCVFVEINDDQDQAIVNYDWHLADTPDVRGVYLISDFISEDSRQAARAGKPTIIHDTQTDPRVDHQRYAALNVYACVSVPFHRQGVWMYTFTVHASAPRQWRNDEVQLIQEVANATFPRMERAYAEQALQTSEAKYRTLFNEMDEGYCIAEILLNDAGKPVDYRILEANPRFEQLTALSLEVALSGRTIRDIAPELEEHWYEIYGRVALTGESARFEQQAAGWGRWYDVYASRIGAPEKRQVAILFNDITDRQAAENTLEQQIRQEYLLNDIAQEIRQSLDLHQILRTAVHRVREWLACDRVIVVRFQPNWQGEVVMESVGRAWLAMQSTTITDACLEERFLERFRRDYVSVLHDIHQADLAPCYVDMLRLFQVQASLTAPILRGNTLWGLFIAHQCDAPRQWQDSEIALLKRLTTQVGIAIHQSELYAQTRRELLARQQIQAVLEESEARFRSLSAAAPIGICQTTAAGICLYANPRWCALSGLSLEDCLGDGWFQGVHPEDYELLTAAWTQYLENHHQTIPDFRLRTPAGDIHWVSMRVGPMISPGGDTIGHVLTAIDITQQTEIKEALLASEQRLQAILDNSPAAIYMLDADNRHVLVNQSYADLFATTPARLVGQTLHDLWPAEVADTFVAQNRTVLASGQRLQFEDMAPLADGIHSYITVKFPLYDGAGQPYALCGISTDITERKRLEAQFYHAQWLENLGTLASGIAHDLNNILTPILTMTQLLRLTQVGLDPKGQEKLNLIERSAKRGANLVKQILAVTRAPNGHPIPVDPVAALWEEIALMGQSFPKTIQIQPDLPLGENPPPLGTILTDPTYLHQIILNLCVNARDAMPQGGLLTLAAAEVWVDEAPANPIPAAQPGAYVRITVADTGCGISPEVQRQMFDPFFTTKAPSQGTGLGLATVRELVKASGGFLQVLSEVGQGTQFQVYFPRVADPSPALDPTALPPSTPPPSPGATLLLVEDEEIGRDMLRSLLESQHYRLLLAQDGVVALSLYHQHQEAIQLVITDIMMPVLDGFSVIESLRSQDASLPIIAFSGIPSHAKQALASGANVFLDKPFDVEMLLNQVAFALWQSAKAT